MNSIFSQNYGILYGSKHLNSEEMFITCLHASSTIKANVYCSELRIQYKEPKRNYEMGIQSD